MNYELHLGDCLEVMRSLPAATVQTCVTSPPYYGLRDYQVEGQIGLEDTPEAYVAKLVDVFREVRRVLRDDGTVFLNLGDSYYGSGARSENPGGKTPKQMTNQGSYSFGEQRARAYGNGDKATQGYPLNDSISQSLCDARIDEWMNHIERTGAHPVRVRVAALYQRIQECMAELRDHLPSVDSLAQQSTWLSSPAIEDRVQTAIRVAEQLLAFLESMPAESLPPLQAGFRLSDMLSLCLTSLGSLLNCVRTYAHMLDAPSEMQRYKAGSVSLFEELAHHIRCIDGYCSLVFSWLNPPQVQPYYTTGLLKPKDLIGIPWMVAFALRADGWYLRSEIIWHKRAPMPESVQDRPTKAHEQLFLLAKSPKYFYDATAIMEPNADPQRTSFVRGHKTDASRNDADGNDRFSRMTANGRNKRSVWTLGPESYNGAHFATMPTKLVEPCILAGTSAHGCCAACGSPWARVVERDGQYQAHWAPGKQALVREGIHGGTGVLGSGMINTYKTTGWQPTCACGCAGVVPCVVLDPFAGSGTTLAVALKHGRNAIGIELNGDYLALAHQRIRQSQPLLFQVTA